MVSVTRTPGGVDAFRAVLSYFERDGGPTFREALEKAVRQTHASLEAKEVLMSIAEELKAEGRAEGRAEAARQLLQKLLRLKFPDLTEDALGPLETASEAQLDTWAERVLTATVIDDIFR